MTDPIADFITRVRNAVRANHRIVQIPASNMKREMTKILKEKGYILDYKFVALGHNTIRGAAGAAILNAELMKQEGLL